MSESFNNKITRGIAVIIPDKKLSIFLPIVR